MALIIPLVDTGQIAMVAVAVVFGSIATLAVGLRLLAARMAHRRLDASDYCILVAWLFTLGLMVVCILGMIPIPAHRATSCVWLKTWQRPSSAGLAGMKWTSWTDLALKPSSNIIR